MKLIRKELSGTGGCLGSYRLQAESDEDMWHLYNLIVVGDVVTATTMRKVNLADTQGGDLGSPAGSERIKMTLSISVEAIEYDSDAAELRLRGRVCVEPTSKGSSHVSIGSYHTLTIAKNRALTVEKREEPGWDLFARETVQRACSEKAKIGQADVAVLLIEEGHAQLHLVNGAEGMSMRCARVEMRIPKKYGAAAAGIDKARGKFFARCAASIEQHVDFATVQCLVLAGPGFTKEEFRKYLSLESARGNGQSAFSESKVVIAHASSTYGSALQEVLTAPEVAKKISNTLASSQVQALERFYAMLGQDETRAFYGPAHVEAANEMGAIDELLITDSLFRNRDAPTRTKYTQLVEAVRAGNGKAHIFSSRHTSGEQLDQMTGVAAILRFPMPELEDLQM